MASLNELKKTTTLSELAYLLGYEPKKLSYILYIIPEEEKYSAFSIPKKNGGERIINAPTHRLKILQKKVAELLNNCFEDIWRKSKHKKSLSHGFRKGHTIITNAKKHTKKRHVFNVDLKDFFPSINFGRVRGFFIKNAHFELDPKVATVLAQISCHNNSLPQGSPCSPIISNLIGHLIDIRMANLAKKFKCTYTRYADDLTFSTNIKNFPTAIAILKDGSNNEWIPGKQLIKEIIKIGFEINLEKVSMQYKTKRQVATGLVVNNKVNVKKEYYRQARAMCHSLFKTNVYFIDNKEEPGKLKQLEGILSFVYQVKAPTNENKEKIGNITFKPTGLVKLYREFLFYKYFFSLKLPLVVCEGKTDIIYLRCALKQLEKEYGQFIEKTGEKYKFKISFLKWPKNFKEVCAIPEGSTGLATLLQIFEKHMRPFKAEGKKHPVIMLVDNDDGLKSIKSSYKKVKKEDFDSALPFSFFIENLYIAPIPLIDDKKETSIEDLFDRKVLRTKLDGKTFNPKPKIDKKTEYSKIVFANKVIAANQESINFNGFKPVLNSFSGVIADYEIRKKI